MRYSELAVADGAAVPLGDADAVAVGDELDLPAVNKQNE